MILTKNRLKKIRKTIDDDDMLNYLKYSHLDLFDNKNKYKSFEDKATQFPEMMNKSTQTKDTADKGVDTYDDLNVVVGDYDLYGNHSNINKNDKMVQVNTLKRTNPNSPPSSSSSDGSPFLRNVERGLRVAQLTGSAMLTAFNIADTVGSAVLSPVIDSALDYLMSNPSNEEVEEEVPTGSADAPQTRERSRSRDDSSENDLGNRLLRRGASRSRSSTPDRGRKIKKNRK